MCGKTLFGNLVHVVASDLHFNPSTLLRHQGDVQGLVTICLGMVQPIAQAVGMRLVNLADSHVDIETFLDFLIPLLGSENDTHGKNIVNLVESDVLVLHLAPNGIRTLYARLDFIRDSHAIKRLSDRCGEIVEQLIALFLGKRQFLADAFIFLWMFKLETQVFKFGLNLVQSQTIGKRSIYI